MSDPRIICTFPDGWSLFHQGDGTPLLGKPGFPAAFLTTKSVNQLARLHAIQAYLDSPAEKAKPDTRCAIEALKILHRRRKLPRHLEVRYEAYL